MGSIVKEKLFAKRYWRLLLILLIAAGYLITTITIARYFVANNEMVNGDFFTLWGGGKLVNSGFNPYDQVAWMKVHEDNGSTWSKMTATDLPNPNAGTDAVTLSDGRQLLIYNHTTREGAFPRGRNMLNLAVSLNGNDWKPVMTLERQEGEYSYPAIIQAKNGLVHITYTYRRRSVKYAVVDPEKL